MEGKRYLLVIFLIIFPSFFISAQETFAEPALEIIGSQPISDNPDFWIAIGADAAFYSLSSLSDFSSLSYGGSFAFGYGSGSSIGIKAIYFFNVESFSLLEADLLLRFYLFGRRAYWGPFIQIMGGASLINFNGEFSVPSNTGIFNAGVSFGWRFLFMNRFFIEPAIRGGYPYRVGLGIGLGVRF